MENPQDVIQSIRAILKTRKYDYNHNLETSFRVNGKWIGPDDTLNVIRKLTRNSPRTHCYEIDYQINGGFQYSLQKDAINKQEAKGDFLREMSDEVNISISRIRKVKR
jgi:hypothetical protein